MGSNVEAMNRNSIIALLVGIALGAGGYYVVDLLAPIPDAELERAGAFSALEAVRSLTETEPEPVTEPEPAPSVATAPPEPDLPELPITITFVPSPDGRAYAVRLFNETQKFLVVAVEMENATFDQKMTVPPHLNPGAVTELNARNTTWTFLRRDDRRLDGRVRAKDPQDPVAKRSRPRHLAFGEANACKTSI